MQTNGSRFGMLQGLIVVLAAATALIHLTLNFPDPVFILNGLGYLGLVGALYLPLPFFKDHRRLVRYALMAFTLVTIVLWAAFGARNTLGYVDKLIEVALLVCLWIENTARRPVAEGKVS